MCLDGAITQTHFPANRGVSSYGIIMLLNSEKISWLILRVTLLNVFGL